MNKYETYTFGIIISISSVIVFSFLMTKIFNSIILGLIIGPIVGLFAIRPTSDGRPWGWQRKRRVDPMKEDKL